MPKVLLRRGRAGQVLGGGRVQLVAVWRGVPGNNNKCTPPTADTQPRREQTLGKRDPAKPHAMDGKRKRSSGEFGVPFLALLPYVKHNWELC